MSAAEWIAERRELLAEFLKPYRGKRHDNVGLSILAQSDLPRALDALEAVLALHRREERWGYEDYSIDAYLTAFDVCVECSRVEQSIEQRDGVAVLEGLWPCPTAAAIEAALRGES